MAKRVTPEMLLEQRIGSVVRAGLRVHGIEPSSPAYDIGVTVALGVLAALNDARRELGWTEPADSDTQWGYAFVDSPTSVCGPVSELTARRKVDGDYSAVLHRRDLIDGTPGPWQEVETR